MDDEIFNRNMSYRATMSIVRSMLLEGIITDKEYEEIDTIMSEKYRLNSSHIFYRNPLIYNDNNGNMSPT